MKYIRPHNCQGVKFAHFWFTYHSRISPPCWVQADSFPQQTGVDCFQRSRLDENILWFADDIMVWLSSSFVPALQLIMWPAPPHGRNNLRAFPTVHVKVLYEVHVIILLAMFAFQCILMWIKANEDRTFDYTAEMFHFQSFNPTRDCTSMLL